MELATSEKQFKETGELKQRAKILEVLDTPISVIEIAEKTNINKVRVFYCLGELKCKGLIVEDKKRVINGVRRKCYKKT